MISEINNNTAKINKLCYFQRKDKHFMYFWAINQQQFSSGI